MPLFMTKSMTAFARMQAEFNELGFCWEIKSVNHRYLDASFRLPESWRFLETDLRTLIRQFVSRGKVECQLKINTQNLEHSTLVINEPLVNHLVALSHNLTVTKQLANDVTVSTLLTWPGVIQSSELDVEQCKHAVIQLFQSTLAKLHDLRAREGEALRQHIQNRLERLQLELTKAKSFVKAHALQTRDRLLTRLHSLQLEVDSGRIEQELAIILTKMDVNEELDRITVHVNEVGKVLRDKEPTGRRLDFLMQELNREANTLSAKSDTVTLTQIAVEMKVLIEQMREQIQNIE